MGKSDLPIPHFFFRFYPRILATRNSTARPNADSKKIWENPPADAEVASLKGLVITETSPMSTEPPEKMPTAPIARNAKVILSDKITSEISS